MSIIFYQITVAYVNPIPYGVPQANASGKIDLGWIPTNDLTLILRHGVESERLNIVFATGEAWWSTDKERLWIGNGVISGGVVQGSDLNGAFSAVLARTFL